MGVRAADILVIGAGVVGLAVALALRLAGRQVVVLDEAEPMAGCSAGNAGWIATSEVLPLATMSRLAQVPRMLLDPLGPLSIRRQDVMRLAPWFLASAFAATPANARRTTAALSALNNRALPAMKRLLAASGADHRLIERGALEVAADQRQLAGLRKRAAILNAAGVRAELLDAEELRDLEPDVRGQGAIFLDGVAHVTDPAEVGLGFAKRLEQDNQPILQGRVIDLEVCDSGCRVRTPEARISASQVVVCAGLWSKDLMAKLGYSVPVTAERGYHLMLPSPAARLARPVAFLAESFVATPMSHGLRLAGTAEFASPDAPPIWRRAWQLEGLARKYLPGLSGSDARPWMGTRPTFPDSLPAIGRADHAASVLYAFGHQHLGLTQAGITAECIVALALGRRPPIDVSPYGLQRFALPR